MGAGKRNRVQHRLSGPDSTPFLERTTPSAIATLGQHRSTLSCFLHPITGGIVDDTVITRLGPELFYLVTNAACRNKDAAYLSEHLRDMRVSWEMLDGWGLIALQGPLSAEILQPLLATRAKSDGDEIKVAEDAGGAERSMVADDVDLRTLLFGQSRFLYMRLASGNMSSTPVLVSRAGYTGEDGFELSVPPGISASVAEALLRAAGPEKLRLAGLGARDSLRLEAGMCLYGQDLDDTTTPVEAGLGWVVAKGRRTDGGFFGDEVILRQLRATTAAGAASAPGGANSAEVLSRRRVGMFVEGAPARQGAKIYSVPQSSSSSSSSPPSSPGKDADEAAGAAEVVGEVTSGCPSPSLQGKNIAMGYVRTGFHRAGTELQVSVRGKQRRATVTKMPFVETKYWRGTTPSG
jgi:aminomethyltransferase